jgi:signal transduction protein with GAF and PtsI domain
MYWEALTPACAASLSSSRQRSVPKRTVLERVVDAARDLIGAQHAPLGALDRSKTELERFVTAGVDEETRPATGALSRGRGVLGELISDPRPLRLADVGAHPHSYGVPAGHPHMKTFLGVPVLVAGQPFGNLLGEKRGSRRQRLTSATSWMGKARSLPGRVTHGVWPTARSFPEPSS